MSKVLKVSNGKETFEINDTDLNNAVKDGFLPTERLIVANSKTKESFEIDPKDYKNALKDGFNFSSVVKSEPVKGGPPDTSFLTDVSNLKMVIPGGVKPVPKTSTAIDYTKPINPAQVTDELFNKKVEEEKARKAKDFQDVISHTAKASNEIANIISLNGDDFTRNKLANDKIVADFNSRFNNLPRTDNTYIDIPANIRQQQLQLVKGNIPQEEVDAAINTKPVQEAIVRKTITDLRQKGETKTANKLASDLYMSSIEDANEENASTIKQNREKIEKGEYDFLHGRVIKPQGLGEAIKTGFNERTKSYDLGHELLFGSKENNIKLLNKREDELDEMNNPHNPLPVPTGIGGNLGHFVGSEGIGTVKGVAPNLIPGVGTAAAAALTAEEMGMRSYGDKTLQVYVEQKRKLKEQHPDWSKENIENVAYETANESGKAAGWADAALGAYLTKGGGGLNSAERMWSKEAIAAGKSIPKESLSTLKKIGQASKEFAGETIKTGIPVGAAAGGAQVAKNLYDISLGIDKKWDEGVADAMKGMLLLHTMFHAAGAVGKGLVKGGKAIYQAFSKMKPEDVKQIGNNLVEDRILSRYEADAIVNDIEAHRLQDLKIPAHITDTDSRLKIHDKIEEHDKLRAQLKGEGGGGLHESYAGIVKEKIKKVEDEIHILSQPPEEQVRLLTVKAKELERQLTEDKTARTEGKAPKLEDRELVKRDLKEVNAQLKEVTDKVNSPEYKAEQIIKPHLKDIGVYESMAQQDPIMFLKEIASQAQEVDAEGKPLEGGARYEDMIKSKEEGGFPKKLVDQAIEMFPAPKAEPKPESGVSVIMPEQMPKNETFTIESKEPVVEEKPKVSEPYFVSRQGTKAAQDHNIEVAKRMLSDLGVDASFSGYSDTNGVSVYFTDAEGRKYRISDHSVTNKDRIQNEVHLSFDQKTMGFGGKSGVKSFAEQNKKTIDNAIGRPTTEANKSIPENKGTAKEQGIETGIQQGVDATGSGGTERPATVLEPPPATPESTEVAPAPEEPAGTNIKHKTLKEDAANYSLKELADHTETSFEELKAKADKLIEEGATDDIVKRALKDEGINTAEKAVLVKTKAAMDAELEKTNAELAEANASGDVSKIEELSNKAELLRNQAYEIYSAAKKAGSKAGLDLVTQKMNAVPEYSLGEMLNRKREANGGEPLTKEQSAKVEIQSKELTAKEKKIKEKGKELADKIRNLRINKGDRALSNIFSIPVAVYDGAVVTIANAVEQGANLAEAIKRGVDYVKKNGGFKDKIEERAFEKYINKGSRTPLSNEKRLQAVKGRTMDQIHEIRTKIQNKDFSKKEPTPLELDKEILDLRAELQETKHAFDLEVIKDEMAKRHWADKYIGTNIKKTIGTAKAITSGIDDSAVFIQNYLAVIGELNAFMGGKPKIALSSLKEHLFDAFSQKRFDRQLAKLHNSEQWNLIKDSGVEVLEPNSLNEQLKEELTANSFHNEKLNLPKGFPIKDIDFGKLGKLKVAGANINPFQVLKPFERAFTSLGNNLRVKIFLEKANLLLEEGKTFKTHPQEFKDLARVVNELTGRGKQNKYVELANPVVTAAIWSPKLLSSGFNALGISDLVSIIPGAKKLGTEGFYRKLTPAQRKYALKKVSAGLSVGIAVMAGAAYAGMDVDADPRSVTFGDIKMGENKSLNVFGRFSSIVKVLVQSIMSERVKNGQEEDLDSGKYGKKNVGGVVGGFLRGKMTPVGGLMFDYKMNSGKHFFSGEEMTIQNSLKQIAPISLQNLGTGLERDGSLYLLNDFLPNLAGLKVTDQRDFQKFKKRGGFPKRPTAPKRPTRPKRPGE